MPRIEKRVRTKWGTGSLESLLLVFFLSWIELSDRNWQTLSLSVKSTFIIHTRAYYMKELTLSHSALSAF